MRQRILLLLERPEYAEDVAGRLFAEVDASIRAKSRADRQIACGTLLLATAILRVRAPCRAVYLSFETRIHPFVNAEFLVQGLQYVVTLSRWFWASRVAPLETHSEMRMPSLTINIYYALRMVQNWSLDVLLTLATCDDNVNYWLDQLEFVIHDYYQTLINEADTNSIRMNVLAARFRELTQGLRSDELNAEDQELLRCVAPAAILPPPSAPPEPGSDSDND